MIDLRSAYRRLRYYARPRPATVLIIVPVYNVETYLAECLESIADQSFTNYVIVAVNDGSTDASLAIVRAAARTDSRIIVVNQRNAGLGAARNRALRMWKWRPRIRPDFVTFLDSDDVLPRDALKTLVESLRRSGSDLAVGSIARFTEDPKVTWKPYWVVQAHEKPRSGTTIAESPEALYDIVACNRMMRRSFWDDAVGTFPEGVVYEDHLPILELYLRATSFDILKPTTYLWRQRVDQSSLGQQKHQIENLNDRARAKYAGLARVRKTHSPAIVQRYIARVLNIDLFSFIANAPDGEDGYWEMLREVVSTFVAAADEHPDTWDMIAAKRKLAAWLVSEGRRAELVALIRALEELQGQPLPIANDHDHLVVTGNYVDSDAPLYIRELAERQRQLNARVVDFRESNGVTEITFRIYNSAIDSSAVESASLGPVNSALADEETARSPVEPFPPLKGQGSPCASLIRDLELVRSPERKWRVRLTPDELREMLEGLEQNPRRLMIEAMVARYPIAITTFRVDRRIVAKMRDANAGGEIAWKYSRGRLSVQRQP